MSALLISYNRILKAEQLLHNITITSGKRDTGIEYLCLAIIQFSSNFILTQFQSICIYKLVSFSPVVLLLEQCHLEEQAYVTIIYT